MIRLDEDALTCDLAETYQIYDYKQLPVSKAAVFACGLRNDSRIKTKASGQSVPINTLLLAGISDRLSALIWFQTEDGQKGRNRPTMLVDFLTGKSETSKDIVVFASGKDFEKTRNELVKIGGGG